MVLQFCRQISEKYLNFKFYENTSSGSRVVHVDKQTDRHDEAKIRYSRVFVNRPKKPFHFTSLT